MALVPLFVLIVLDGAGDIIQPEPTGQTSAPC